MVVGKGNIEGIGIRSSQKTGRPDAAGKAHRIYTIALQVSSLNWSSRVKDFLERGWLEGAHRGRLRPEDNPCVLAGKGVRSQGKSISDVRPRGRTPEGTLKWIWGGALTPSGGMCRMAVSPAGQCPHARPDSLPRCPPCRAQHLP